LTTPNQTTTHGSRLVFAHPKQLLKWCCFRSLFALSLIILSGRTFLFAAEGASTATPSADNAVSTPAAPPKLVEDSDKIISDIQFTGNSLNKSKSLERKIKTKRQQKLDRKKISADIKTLFETGDFDDVTADVVELSKSTSKGKPLVKIIFTVQERSIIDSLRHERRRRKYQRYGNCPRRYDAARIRRTLRQRDAHQAGRTC
jgi:hypothetical protein